MFAYEFEMAAVTATVALVYNKMTGSFQTGQFRRVPMILIGWRQDDSDAYPGAPCLPGGFVDVPETTKSAATRETKEETNLNINEDRWDLFYVDDKPGTDPRFKQIVNVCYMAKISEEEHLEVQASDDLKHIKWIPYQKVQKMNLAFNHNKVVDELLIHLAHLR